MNYKSFAELQTTLKARTETKLASVKAAARPPQGDPVSDVKDPDDKGKTAVPVDASAAPALQRVPESARNTEVTKVLSISPDKTIQGDVPVKDASKLASQAKKIATNLKKLATEMRDDLDVTPGLPNKNKNEGTADGKLQPPSGGTAKGNNPDANADTAKSATGDMPPMDKDEKKVKMPKGDSKGEMPKETENKDGEKEKEASEFPVDVSFHVKLASLLLSTEEGRTVAQAVLEKAAGAEIAQDCINAAMYMEKVAAEAEQAQAEGAAAADEMWNSMTPEEREKTIKIASVHYNARNQFGSELEKQAYDAGAGAAAGMGDMMAQGGGEGAGAAPQPGAEPEMPPVEDGQISDEMILQALQELVQEGKITEEQAGAILQELQGGGQGGEMPPGAGGEMPPDGMPGGAAGGAEPAAPEKPAMQKEAPIAGGETMTHEKKEPEKKEKKKEEKKEASVLDIAGQMANDILAEAAA